MTDQMPDEVWVADDWLAHYDEPWEGGTHYIRADLYEQAGEFDYQGIDPADLGQHFTDAMQALTTRNAVSKAACAQLIAEQAQRAEQAEADRMKAWEHLQRTEYEFQQTEAERDRYRAALEGIRDMPYSSRKPHTVFDASARAQEALADIADDPYDYQRVQDKAQEALSHG